MKTEPADMIVLGRIVGPYSLRGWLNIHFFGDDPAALGDMPQWWLGKEAEARADKSAWRAFGLQQLRPHGKGMIAKLEGIDDRTAAEAIDGCYIAAPRSALPKTTKDEYYWADLIGLRVVNMQEVELGRLVSLMTAGAHDVLCVKDASGHERLLPFVTAIVKKVDLPGGEMQVDWGSDW